MGSKAIINKELVEKKVFFIICRQMTPKFKIFIEELLQNKASVILASNNLSMNDTYALLCKFEVKYVIKII